MSYLKQLLSEVYHHQDTRLQQRSAQWDELLAMHRRAGTPVFLVERLCEQWWVVAAFLDAPDLRMGKEATNLLSDSRPYEG